MSGVPATSAARGPVRRGALLGALAVSGALLGGCTTLGDAFTIDEVRPWQRDVLAREDMQLVTDAMDDAVDDHMYFSREASSGGGSVRGGGCGCN